MHWIWRVAVGVTVAVLMFISPHHGFWESTRYHAYSNVSGSGNALAVIVYLACAILIGSGLYLMFSRHIGN